MKSDKFDEVMAAEAKEEEAKKTAAAPADGDAKEDA